ncbi:Myb-like protein J [Phytophthora citrophthora]|uniref:Myb-like protein J n=1 Tax=Phytophthora citrophthora TaxID=4793 RepID=A0AAD9LG72_9STRA|nr:Myb-like protein J [Phytophthora citrophthora]KAK1934104.1 Myb-like protein J [Phytophthora citrophthora]
MSRHKSSRPRLSREGEGVWTANEHVRFLEAVELYPHGPWKLVAAYIGTRSTRQAMTHAQKYRQKLERRRRGLRNTRPKTPKTQPPSWSPSESLENEPMFSYEQLMITDIETWRYLEPLPLTAPYPTLRSDTEPAWVDDCFAFFVDNFSC